jgi:hypothetical protein
MAAFFAGQPVAACANPRPIIAPTAIAPTRLSLLSGATKARKAVSAAAATVRDVRLQFLGDELAAGRVTPVGAKVAGLRSGRATATSSGYSLRQVEFVPGITVTGIVPVEPRSATFAISGRVAPHGRLTFHPDGSVTGRLGGRSVSVHHVQAAQLVTRGMGIGPPRHGRRLQLG